MNKHIAMSIHGASFSSSSFDPASAECASSIYESMEIIFIVSGTGRLTVEGQIYDFTRGNLFLIPEMQYRMMESDSSTVEYYSIRFLRSSVLSEVAEHMDTLFSEGICKRYSFSSSQDGLFSVFERFEALAASVFSEKSLYFKMLISELIILLAMAKEDVHVDKERDLGSRVIRYLSDNIDRDISLDSLARRFFVSKYYLCRAFKKRNGISPHSYINYKRVLYAKQLIEDGESASAAAYKVGFGDYSAFYRAYVKHLGTSPMASGNAITPDE